VHPASPVQIALGKLKQHSTARIASRVLLCLYSASLLAGFLSPYALDSEVRDHSYHPPSQLHWIDTEGHFHWIPFVYAQNYTFNEVYARVWQEDRERRYSLTFWVKGESYRFLGLIPSDRHLWGVEKPGRLYLLGADSRGRDLLTRILYGSQVSLSVGLLGVLISFCLGTLVGGLAGYFGGWVDNVLMRLVEMIMMIPGFYLMLALRAAFPPELSSTQAYLLIILILSFIGWAGLARIVRGMALSLKTKEYVLAARALGASHFSIVVRHIIPNTASYLMVAATLSIPGYILGESALSLLGLGIQDPQASWGNLLAESMAISQVRFHPWVLWPGLCIFLVVMAFNFLGDGLRDAFDPRNE
jgi:peptide/nickel transport system permease protein